MHEGRGELEAEIVVEFAAYDELPGVVQARGEEVFAVGIGPAEGLDGGGGNHGGGDGHVAGAGALAQEFVFDEAVVGFFVAAAAQAYCEVVGDAEIEAEANGGIVQAEHFVEAAVERAEAVGDFEIEYARSGIFQRVQVDDPVGFEGGVGEVDFLVVVAEQGEEIILSVERQGGGKEEDENW